MKSAGQVTLPVLKIRPTYSLCVASQMVGLLTGAPPTRHILSGAWLADLGGWGIRDIQPAPVSISGIERYKVALVLLVDDDDMVLRVLSMFLSSEGHDTLTAPDANKAMDIVRSTALGLVITDLRMNPISGLDLLRMIKAEKPNLPVILLTAFASAKTAREANQLGAAGYLSKPFTNEEVLKTVEKAIASGVTSLPPPPPPPPPPL